MIRRYTFVFSCMVREFITDYFKTDFPVTPVTHHEHLTD